MRHNASSSIALIPAEPRERGFPVAEIEMPDLGLHEMGRDPWHDRKEGAVRDRRDPTDVAMVVADEVLQIASRI